MSVPVDGWWPRIQFPYVLMGNTHWTVMDLRSMRVVAEGNGWQHGWLDETHFVTSRQEGPRNEDRMVQVNGVDGSARTVYTGRVGNVIVTTPGHIVWATTDGVWVDGKRIAEGRFLPQSPMANGNTVAIVEQVAGPEKWDSYQTLLVRNGSIVKRNIVTHPEANIVIPSPDGGLLFFGYFGPSRMMSVASRTIQGVNRTPNESPAFYVGDDWIVTTCEAEGVPGILVGPLFAEECAQRWRVNAMWVTAQQLSGIIHVVSSGDRGQFAYNTFSIDEKRTKVNLKKPPMPEPRITIISYAPQNGASPLKVKAIWDKEPNSGPIESIAWLYRAEGAANWTIAAVNHPNDPDHTYTLQEGRWEIALRAVGPGGEAQTGKKRLVVAEGAAETVIVKVGDLIDVGNGAQVVKNIRADGLLKVLMLVDAEEPPPPPPPPSGKLSGNFLAFPGYEFAFLYPAWDEGKRRAFRQAYRVAGHNWLPISPWAKYNERGEYDFSTNPEGFNDIIRELQQDGIEPVVMIFTDIFKGSHPRSLQEAKNWASGFIPKLQGVRLASTGWEFNQINGSEWTGDGAKHLEWARHLKRLLPSTTMLFAHFSPERITGYPNYPNHDGPQDEAGWWKDNNPLDGLLYQRSPDEPITKLLDHTTGGNGDVGDASRIAGSYWGLSGLRFYLFEFARDNNRHKEVVDKIRNNPLISGWC